MFSLGDAVLRTVPEAAFHKISTFRTNYKKESVGISVISWKRFPAISVALELDPVHLLNHTEVL